MAGKVLASRSPWDRKTKAMMSLSSSPASFVSVSFEPRLSRPRRFDSNGIGQKQTVAQLECKTILIFIKCYKCDLLQINDNYR